MEAAVATTSAALGCIENLIAAGDQLQLQQQQQQPQEQQPLQLAGNDLQNGSVEEDEDEEEDEEDEDDDLENDDLDFDEDFLQSIDDGDNDHQYSEGGDDPSCLYGLDGYRWSIYPPPSNQSQLKTSSSEDLLFPDVAGPARAGSFTDAGQLWSLLFTEAMLDGIVEATNRELEYKRTEATRRNQRVTNTDRTEVRALFGLLYLMGAYKHPSEEVAGLFNVAEGTGRPIFTAVMTFTRITTLLRHIRVGGRPSAAVTVAEQQAEGTSCQLPHFRRLFGRFFENAQANFTAGEHLTVDHLLTKGVLKENGLPRESTTLKTFLLTDSMTSYVLNGLLEGYQNEEEEEQINGGRYLSPPTAAVLYLVKGAGLFGRSQPARVLTASRPCYASLELAYELAQRQLRFLGPATARWCRQLPRDFFLPRKVRRRPVGSALYAFSHSSPATAVSYMARKNAPLSLLSTAHHEVRQNEATGKPEVVHLFEATRAAISPPEREGSIRAVLPRHQQLQQSPHGCFELELLCQLLDLAAVNAHQLWQMAVANLDSEELGHRDFVAALGRALVLPEVERRSSRGMGGGAGRDIVDAMNKVLRREPLSAAAVASTSTAATVSNGSDKKAAKKRVNTAEDQGDNEDSGEETEVDDEEAEEAAPEMEGARRTKRRCAFCRGRETKVRTVCFECRRPACLKRCLKALCPDCYSERRRKQQQQRPRK